MGVQSPPSGRALYQRTLLGVDALPEPDLDGLGRLDRLGGSEGAKRSSDSDDPDERGDDPVLHACLPACIEASHGCATFQVQRRWGAR